ncbi:MULTISPECIES: AraC family transcriptional regulator [unclassified Pseudomonas]|uniref:AraC-like transcriptional regulator QhpR n=1 Tax=unclassified Pseudomonas TaxID=196821 RepID=UPI0013048CEB|nr:MULTISPECIES: AraC family transcriptional regulator [unclassified Pseudomonas]
MPHIEKHTFRPELLFRRHSTLFTPFLDEVGLSPNFCTNSEAETSLANVVRLLELVGQRVDEVIGLRLGLQSKPEDYGVLGQVVRSMATVEEALLGLSRYLVVFQQGARIEVEHRGLQVGITYQISDPTITQRRQDAELSLGALLTFVRRLTACEPVLLRVDFEHGPPHDLSFHREALRCPLHFRQDRNRLYFKASMLELPVRTSNKRLLQALQPFMEEQLKQRSVSSKLFADVCQAIAADLGRVGLVQIADSLGVSERTLQRRMAELDLKFGAMVEDARRALALDYVGKSDYRLTDVALMLGYTEASSFSRAFRRWTQLSPREYRKSQQALTQTNGGSA